MTEIIFVSVIIPTYNNKNYLEKTVKSLCDQSYPKDHYEIIVVDDGSTDGTRQWIEAGQKWYPCSVRYFYQKNKGPAAARNLGVRNALGNIIAFTDADCITSYTWIEEIVKGYECERVVGIGGTIKAMPTSSKISQYCAYIKLNERPLMDKTGVVFLITGNASFRKTSLDLVGGFDERYNFPGGEEPDLCYRLKKKGYFFKYNRNAVVYNHHKETLRKLLRAYFNYGKGDSFLNLRKQSDRDLISVCGLKWIFYFFKMTMKAVFMLRFIIKFLKIPFKTLLYYGEGLNIRDGLMFASLDYATQLLFIQGAFFGYISGRFKGFKKNGLT